MALVFWVSDPLIDRFYKSLSIKGSVTEKQRSHKLLWMLWFDEKSISNQHAASSIVCERNHKSIKRYFKETAAKMRPTLLLLYYWTHGSVADKKVEATKLAWLSWWKQSHQCSSLNNQHSFYIKVTSTYIVYYIVLIKESPNGKSESNRMIGYL